MQHATKKWLAQEVSNLDFKWIDYMNWLDEFIEIIITNEFNKVLHYKWCADWVYEIVYYIEAKDKKEYYITIDSLDCYKWDDSLESVESWASELISKWENSIAFFITNLK